MRSFCIASMRSHQRFCLLISSVLLVCDHIKMESDLFRCSSQASAVRTIQFVVFCVHWYGAIILLLPPPSQPVRTAQRVVEVVG